MNQNVQDFIASKNIAVVGVSRSGKKFGNSIVTELKQRGYQVFIVHPEAQEIGGDRCYPNLAALQGKVDAALICVTPKQAGQALREAAAAGIQRIWLQQGADSPETKALASELGVQPVTGKCILMYASATGKVSGLHGFHGTIMKLVGQY
jgi:uncharacterized protein